MRLACFLFFSISLILSSCGTNRFGKLKYVKLDNSSNENYLSNNNLLDSVSIMPKKTLGLTVKNESLEGKSIILTNSFEQIVETKVELTKKEVFTTKTDEKKKKRRRLKDYEDDQSLDNSHARKLVAFSIFSFLPIFGLIFGLLTIYRARKEWARIDYKPKVYSGKRKIVLAKLIALIALYFKILVFIVSLILIVLLVLMA